MENGLRWLAPGERHVKCERPRHPLDVTDELPPPVGFQRLGNGTLVPVSVLLRPPAYEPLPYLMNDLLETLDGAVAGGYDVRLVREWLGGPYHVHIGSKSPGIMSMTILIYREGTRRGHVKKVTVNHPPVEVQTLNGITSTMDAAKPESLTGHPSAVAAIRAALDKYPTAEPHVVKVPRGHIYHPQRGVTIPVSRLLKTEHDLWELPGVHSEVVEPLTRLQKASMMVRLLCPEALNRPRSGTYEIEALHGDGLLWGGWWVRLGVSRKNGRITEIHTRSARDMRHEWNSFTPQRREKLEAVERSPHLVFGHEFREGSGYRKGPVQSLQLLNEVVTLIEDGNEHFAALGFHL